MALTKMNIFFNDVGFSFVCKKDGFSKIQKYGTVKLPTGAIENGEIKDKELVTEIIKETFKLYKIRASRVNILLSWELYSFRKAMIPIDVMEKELKKYIRSQIGKTINLPYEDPLFDVHEYRVLEEEKEIIIFSVSESKVRDYFDLFEDIEITVSGFDLMSLAAHRLYYIRKTNDKEFESNVMFVNCFEKSISISIFEENIPVFMLSTELDFKNEEWDFEAYFGKVSDEIYRIANYYKFNINKGQKEVKKLILYSGLLNDSYNYQLVEEIRKSESTIEIEFFDLSNIEDHLETHINPRYYLPLAASFKGVR